MKNLLVAILTFCSCALFAQYEKYMEQGEKSESKLEFNGAILKYLSAYEVNPTREAVRKIADTYYLIEDWKKAESWYFKLFSYTEQDAEDYYQYIICQAFLGNKEKTYEFLGLLKDFYPNYKINPAFERWLDQRFYNPCMPDKTKDAKISYCISMDIRESIDSNNLAVKFYWKFDDGTEKTGPVVSHCFRTAGNHEITLSSVDSSMGLARISDTTFTVPFVEQAMFKLSGNRTLGKPVNFYAFNLKDHPHYYGMVWELGDGTLHFKEAFVHEFFSPGSKKIVLHIFGKNDNDEIYQIACLTQNWNISRGG